MELYEFCANNYEHIYQLIVDVSYSEHPDQLPLQATRGDTIIWDHSTNGRLNLKEAYKHAGTIEFDSMWKCRDYP
ncbi:hypothetical protein JHK84_047926 [Glycine max]|nr:hypothetical protein JHK84_047926 [Glycine max]